MNNSLLDVQMLERELGNLLTAYPELKDDSELRTDMIEGSTAAFDVLDRIVAQAQDAGAVVIGIKMIIDGLSSRKASAERRQEAMRSLALRIMQAAELQKVTLARATLSVRTGVPGVQLVDEAVIPDAFWKVTRTPDKAAIKEALKAGDDVPGAVLGNAAPGLTIRVS